MALGPISPRALLISSSTGAAAWRRSHHGSPRRRCNDDSGKSEAPVADPTELPQLHDARGGAGTLTATQLRFLATVRFSDHPGPVAPLKPRPQRSRPRCRGMRHEVVRQSNDDYQRCARGRAAHASPARTVKPALPPAAPPVAASCSAAGADCAKLGLREALSDNDVGNLPVVVAIVEASDGFLRFQDYRSNIFRGDRKAILEGMRETDYRMAQQRRKVAREAGMAARRQAREASMQRQLQRSQAEVETRSRGQLRRRPSMFDAAVKVQKLIRDHHEEDAIHEEEDDEEEEEVEEFCVEVMAGKGRPKEVTARRGRPKSFSPKRGGEQDPERERPAKPDAAHNPKDSADFVGRRKSSSEHPLALTGCFVGVKRQTKSGLDELLEGSSRSMVGMEPFSKGWLRKVKLASEREERMKSLKKLTKEYVEGQRKDRATRKRQMVYDHLPELEKLSLQKAFDAAAADSKLHDAESASLLDHMTLRVALKEVGLGCETDSEVKTIGNLCNDIALLGDVDFLTFCCDAVPRVREQIKIMRRPDLQQTFQSFDMDRSGFLDLEEVGNIFASLCLHNMTKEGRRHLWSVFNDAIDAVTGPVQETKIDFEAFATLMAEMQEQCQRVMMDVHDVIVKKCGLSRDEVKAHEGELLSIHDTFSKVLKVTRGARPGGVGEERRRDSATDMVDDEGLRAILLEHGLMYDSEAKFQTTATRGWLGELLFRHGGSISFRQVLEVIRQRREEVKFSMTVELQALMSTVDKDQGGTLNVQEVFLLLEKIGFAPHCREDQRRLQRLLGEVDSDSSGSLDVFEFENLVMRLTSRKASDARVRAVKAVEELGYTERDEMQLRDLFYALDDARTQSLGLAAIRAVADRLGIEVAAEALRGLLRQFGGSSEQVDLAGFVRLFRQLTPGQPSIALGRIFPRAA